MLCISAVIYINIFFGGRGIVRNVKFFFFGKLQKTLITNLFKLHVVLLIFKWGLESY